MNGSNRSWLRVGMLMLVSLAAMLGVSMSMAQEGNPDREAQPAALSVEESVDPLYLDTDLDSVMGKVIVIPPSAFVGVGYDHDHHRFHENKGWVMGWNPGGNMLAPVMLPEGASRIVKVRIYAHDGNASNYSTFILQRTLMAKGTTANLGSVYTSKSEGVEVYRITPSLKNVSSARAYQISMYLAQDVYVYGIQVVYE